MTDFDVDAVATRTDGTRRFVSKGGKLTRQECLGVLETLAQALDVIRELREALRKESRAVWAADEAIAIHRQKRAEAEQTLREAQE